MPEPPANPGPIFPNDRENTVDFAARLADSLQAAGFDPEGRHGRIVWIDAQPLRRKIRRFSSARKAVTEAGLLFAGLAYLPADPAETVPTGAERADERHLARVVRTLGDPARASSRATVQAARLLSTAEQAARTLGGSAEWILEGLDFEAIEALLAVPADHRLIGLIAIEGLTCRPESAGPALAGVAPVDLNGFGGCFPAMGSQAGGGPSGLL